MYLYIFMYHHHNFCRVHCANTSSLINAMVMVPLYASLRLSACTRGECISGYLSCIHPHTHTDEKLHYQVNLRLSTYPCAAPVQNASCCARYREKFRPTRNTPGKTCQKLHSNNCKCINAQFRINATHTILVKQ